MVETKSVCTASASPNVVYITTTVVHITVSRIHPRLMIVYEVFVHVLLTLYCRCLLTSVRIQMYGGIIDSNSILEDMI